MLLEKYLKETAHRSYFPEAVLSERVCFKTRLLGAARSLNGLIAELIENPHVKKNMDHAAARDFKKEQDHAAHAWDMKLSWDSCMSIAPAKTEDPRQYRLEENVCNARQASAEYGFAVSAAFSDASEGTLTPLRSDKIVRRIYVSRIGH